MKIYQTSVFIYLFSLLSTFKMATERHLCLGQNRYQNVDLAPFPQIYLNNINNFLHIFFSGFEIRSMHPPNKPHPDQGYSLVSMFFYFQKSFLN